MTAKSAVAKLLLSNTNQAWSTNQVVGRVTKVTGKTAKTVRNVLSILVSVGAAKRATNGYASRNKRKLESFVS